MSVNIKFTAIRANSRLLKLNLAAVTAQIDSATRSFAEDIVEELQKYPPVPAGSTYERTGRLRSNWRVQRTVGHSGIQYSITNPVQEQRPRGVYYSGLVQGRSTQTWFHRSHGWQTVEDVLERRGGRNQLASTVQSIITAELGAI